MVITKVDVFFASDRFIKKYLPVIVQLPVRATFVVDNSSPDPTMLTRVNTS